MEISTFLSSPFTTPFLIAVIIGLIVGSILNIMIRRVPIRIYSEWHRQCKLFLNTYKEPDETMTKATWHRSLCHSCSQPASKLLYIPLIGYFFGKCKSCGQRAPLHHPIVEFLCVISAVFLLYFFGITIKAFASILFSWILIALFFLDSKTQLLPDSIVYTLLWLGLIFSIFDIHTSPPQAISAVVFIYLLLRFINSLYFLMRGREGMGAGDVKFAAALAAWLGLHPTVYVLVASAGANAVFWILQYYFPIKKSLDEGVPFGPYLAVSAWIMMIWLYHAAPAMTNMATTYGIFAK